MTTVLADLDATLAEGLGERAERLDLELVDRAYRLSAAAHRGQKRVSGEDFISHTVAVARILLDHNMDSVTIAAALLHDTVEDSDVSIEDIREQFGHEIGDIVDGLTKISSLSFHSRQPLERGRSGGCLTKVQQMDHRSSRWGRLVV